MNTPKYPDFFIDHQDNLIPHGGKIRSICSWWQYKWSWRKLQRIKFYFVEINYTNGTEFRYYCDTEDECEAQKLQLIRRAFPEIDVDIDQET